MAILSRSLRARRLRQLLLALVTLLTSVKNTESYVSPSSRVAITPVLITKPSLHISQHNNECNYEQSPSRVSRTCLLSSSSSAPPPSSSTSNKLDAALSALTSCFPLYVVSSALIGLKTPQALLWVSKSSSLIPLMLALVMVGTGMTLEKRDFGEVLKHHPKSVPLGILCQFLIMPCTSFVIGRRMIQTLSLSAGGGTPTAAAVFFLGLVLVGCSPGGTASNLVSLVARADVALSVLLTACSTMLASVMTPLLVKLLVGNSVSVSGVGLAAATAKVVLLPVVLGMVVNAKAPRLSRVVSRFAPFGSCLLVALICGGVVAENASCLALGGGNYLGTILASVFALHSVGFLAGYLVPKGCGFSEKTARTVSIETGMQNSALAVVLAKSCSAAVGTGAEISLVALPGALSATMHSCLGSILAAYWRFQDSQKETKSLSS